MVNKVFLIGNLGADPEVRPAGESKVANFTMATSKKTGKGEERKTATQWHNIVAWKQLADISEKYLKKGSKIFVEGEINYRNYQASDGTTKYVTEIIAWNISMLDSKGTNTTASPTPAPQATTQQPATQPQDDLPF